MPGDWLHALHSRHGARLFSANYRDYMGMRSSVKNINFGIKTSAQSEPDNFWTYNNGITAADTPNHQEEVQVRGRRHLHH